MPQRKSSSHRAQRSSKVKANVSDVVVTLPFRNCITQSGASSGFVATAYTLTQAAGFLGTRASQIMKNFEFFRLSSLRITVMQDSIGASTGPTGANSVPGYASFLAFDPAPAADTTAPTTLLLLSQLPEFAMDNGHSMARLSLGPGDLYGATPVKWYHTTTTGSPNASDLSAGCVYTGVDLDLAPTAGNASIYLLLEGVLQLKAPVDSSDA